MFSHWYYPPNYLSPVFYSSPVDTLAPTTCTTADWNKYYSDGSLKQEQEGNNPMFEVNETTCFHARKTDPVQACAKVVIDTGGAKATAEQDQRRHLLTRAYDLRYAHGRDLEKLFHIREPEGPTTEKDLKDRLEKGLYTVKKPKFWDSEVDDVDDEPSFYWRDWFSWRTPETQADRKGFTAAEKELHKVYQSLVDDLKILDPKDGLAALKKFESWEHKK